MKSVRCKLCVSGGVCIGDDRDRLPPRICHLCSPNIFSDCHVTLRNDLGRAQRRDFFGKIRDRARQWLASANSAQPPFGGHRAPSDESGGGPPAQSGTDVSTSSPPSIIISYLKTVDIIQNGTHTCNLRRLSTRGFQQRHLQH